MPYENEEGREDFQEDYNLPSMTARIIAYEDGELSEEEFLALFQDLVASGLAWELQGHYGRTAKALIDSGAINPHVNAFC